MAIQDFTAGQILTAAQMDALQANDYNQTVSTKTDSYVLVAADKGTRLVMNSATAKTFTVNSGLFAAGDTLFIQNIGAGTATITAGTCTVTTAGSLALAQWGGGTLYFTSASAAIFFSGGGANYGTATGGTAFATPPTGYAGSTFTSDGTLTVTKAGLFDVLMFGGGGAGAASQGPGYGSGGGGAGSVIETTLYLAATTYAVTIGAGGAGAANLSGSYGGATILGSVLTAIGGGGGICYHTTFSPTRLPSMGCGGGGAEGGGQFGYNGALGVLGTTYGYNGGNAHNPSAAGGGGGGCKGLGGNASSAVGGVGGIGMDIATFTGNASTFKGGGGGGGGGTGGAGGSGVGGAGVNSGAGTNAAANTASGGGGNFTNTLQGGNGGSGIFYIRWKA